MDILSEILTAARWKGDLLTRRSIGEPWGLRFPCEKSAGFHIVSQGECQVKLRHKTFCMQKGDILFIAKGATHELSSGPGAKILDMAKFCERFEKVVAKGNPLTTFVSIRYEVPQQPMHPFLVELPEYIFIPAGEISAHHTLHTLLSLISQEIEASIGSDLILQKLADILLYQVLRYNMEKNPPRRAPWHSALADEKIRAALESLHRKPEHPWTLASLARGIGLSRASLAGRFRAALGTTPMHYLTALRIERGRELFCEQTVTLEEVARSVGYSSAFAYSKAYKRVTGHAPSAEIRSVDGFAHRTPVRA